jgi:hypothetical protein
MKCRVLKQFSLIGRSETPPRSSEVHDAKLYNLGFSWNLISVLKNGVFMLDLFYFFNKIKMN